MVSCGDQSQATNWDAVATVRMSDRGEVHGVESEDETFRKLIRRLSRKLYPPFPEAGVRSGDLLLAADMDLSALAGANMRGTNAGVVRGLALFEGRRVVVLDLTFEIVTDGTAMNGSGSGYGLLDVETGAWLHTELSAAVEMETNGQPTMFSMTQVMTTGF